MNTIMTEKLVKRSKHDPKVRADKMMNDGGRGAFGILPLAFMGNLGNTLLAPLGYRGKKAKDVAKDSTSPWQGTAQKMQNVDKNLRGAREIREAFGMMDNENAAQASGRGYRSANEVAAGFSAANSKFTGERSKPSTSKGKSDGSDGYVEGHTRRSGTKSVQVKQRRQSSKELRRR